MLSYDPLQKHQRLWNNPEDILSESLSGLLMMHQNLVYVDSCKAVLRRDLDKLIGKVKIVGGGAVIDGLMYAGFVGPGMLTAAALGLHISSVPTSESILEVVNLLVKSEQQKASGVLLLVHDCPEYFLNFLEVKNKIESKGIPIKVVYVRDEVSKTLNQKPTSSPRSPSGLLLLYKIAGAMSEDGNSLDEIYHTCNEIIEKKIIYSTGVYITESSYSKPAQVQISRGDILSDPNAEKFSLSESSSKAIIEYLTHKMVNADNCQKFSPGSKLVIILDYFGGFSELEANIIIKELVHQLSQRKLTIKIIYTGGFHTSLQLKGFHLSLLNLSNNLKFLYYLSVPTLAFSWPKTSGKGIISQMHNKKPINTKEKTENCESVGDKEIKLDKETKFNIEIHETDVFLTAVQFACEALIACSKKIDMLDSSKTPQQMEKCGTRLAKTAEVIKSTFNKKKFAGLYLSNIIFQLALIFGQNVQDPQAGLYRLFLNSLGKAIDNKKNLEASDWFDAFHKAINSIDNLIKGSKFSNTLHAAKSGFCNAYADDENVNSIHALGQAVNAAQKQTSHVLLESGKIPDHLLNEKDYGFVGLAGAHAIGVWMRGAYEGIKLKYSNQEFRNKRKHCDNVASDDDLPKSKSSQPPSSV